MQKALQLLLQRKDILLENFKEVEKFKYKIIEVQEAIDELYIVQDTFYGLKQSLKNIETKLNEEQRTCDSCSYNKICLIQDELQHRLEINKSENIPFCSEWKHGTVLYDLNKQSSLVVNA